MLKTSAKAFALTPLSRLPLFAVQPGVPIKDALERTYSLLDMAQEMAEQAAIADDSTQLCHVIAHLLDMAKAAVDACAEGIPAALGVTHE
ncbi:hypothetical protein PS870_03723 [Pseudomonas fluorescens]|jgi:Protein of unknown function (DUF3077).|uniref:DUF3077 domain-containing protein n=1 Tax=Pseudomonas fluorescens TaxID=294 RepID=A0A5E7M5Z4_PSEFL|nr:DUF3077 domain-containing protein [Pseudomonas fluorescens]VVP19037.1 hypothetical protein PS870_03723 [Pseudomonas fluorescens]